MASPVVQMRFPPELLARIDEARGSQSRSAFIRSAVDVILTHGVSGTVVYQGPGGPHVIGPGTAEKDASVEYVETSPLCMRSCSRGCVVPAATKMKRCIPHGLELT